VLQVIEKYQQVPFGGTAARCAPAQRVPQRNKEQKDLAAELFLAKSRRNT